MRHEMPVELVEHPIREKIPAEAWVLSLQVEDVADQLSDADMADFDIMEADFQWPENWSRKRRALMTFACMSEIQLLAYLQGLRDASSTGSLRIEAGFRDKKVDWVAGIRARRGGE